MPSPAPLQFLASIEEETAANHHREIVERTLRQAARLVEYNADAIMTVAETTDPRVKRAFLALAQEIRDLEVPR